jgi:hypothetical protein
MKNEFKAIAGNKRNEDILATPYGIASTGFTLGAFDAILAL